MRALRRALTEWVVGNTTPPESRYPTIARGELVAPVRSAMNFPAIPGAPLPDNLINALPNYDFGPGLRYNDLSRRSDLDSTARGAGHHPDAGSEDGRRR